MGIVYTVSNTPTTPTVQEIFELGNNFPTIPTSNLRKWAGAKSNSLFGFYFSFFCLSKEKKLKAIVPRIGSAKIENNTIVGENTGSGNAGNNTSNNTGDNARNRDAAGEDNGDNITGAGKEAAASKSATTKNSATRDAAAGTGNNAKNIE